VVVVLDGARRKPVVMPLLEQVNLVVPRLDMAQLLPPDMVLDTDTVVLDTVADILLQLVVDIRFLAAITGALDAVLKPNPLANSIS
jgi:hypothetical protein